MAFYAIIAINYYCTRFLSVLLFYCYLRMCESQEDNGHGWRRSTRRAGADVAEQEIDG